MPHCSAACSRNFCWSGWSVSPCAMPSMVSTRRPPTSQPRTRQEQTSRPSSVTLHAPQSPGGASLLAAGEVERVAEHVEQRVLRLAEELDLVPVHRRRRRDAWPSGSPRPLERDQRRAAREHARDLGTELHGAPLVVDRPARRARRRLEPLLRGLVEACCR